MLTEDYKHIYQSYSEDSSQNNVFLLKELAISKHEAIVFDNQQKTMKGNSNFTNNNIHSPFPIQLFFLGLQCLPKHIFFQCFCYQSLQSRGLPKKDLLLSLGFYYFLPRCIFSSPKICHLLL